MDEDGAASGLSGWAWYQLGSMDAQRRQRARQTVRQLFGRRQPTVDVNSVLAQNQALAAESAQLRAEIAQLRESLEDYRFNYEQLQAWADRQEARFKKGS